ncbi:hypothetical protein SCACP_21530 [Sporomusa carbonis]|uniref:hypothetical protein n=1 Tax=Sporomusa carbonis TaxID=3076075 RepID=UPI003A5EF794
MQLYDYIKPNPPIPPKPPDLFAGMGYVYEDLCEMSPGDSKLWIELFAIAAGMNHDLARRLEYVRGVGAWLKLDDRFGFTIQPIIDPRGALGWTSYEHYDQHGRHQLSVYTREIIQCLSELRKRFDNGRIR